MLTLPTAYSYLPLGEAKVHRFAVGGMTTTFTTGRFSFRGLETETFSDEEILRIAQALVDYRNKVAPEDPFPTRRPARAKGLSGVPGGVEHPIPSETLEIQMDEGDYLEITTGDDLMDFDEILIGMGLKTSQAELNRIGTSIFPPGKNWYAEAFASAPEADYLFRMGKTLGIYGVADTQDGNWIVFSDRFVLSFYASEAKAPDNFEIPFEKVSSFVTALKSRLASEFERSTLVRVIVEQESGGSKEMYAVMPDEIEYEYYTLIDVDVLDLLSPIIDFNSYMKFIRISHEGKEYAIFIVDGFSIVVPRQGSTKEIGVEFIKQ